MSWLLFALLAALASALNVWSSKLLVGRARPELIAAQVHLLGGLLALAALPLLGLSLADAFAPALALLPELALMAVVVAAGNLMYFRALASSELSEIDIFLRSSALWTLLLGAALLGEQMPSLAAAGAALILLSLALVAQRPSGWRDGRLWPRLWPQLLALGAAMLFGAGNVLDKAISGPFHPLAYSVLHLLLGGLVMLAAARPRRSKFADPQRRRALFGRGAWIVGGTFALTQWALIEAYAAGGQAGDVVLVAQLRLVLLVLVGVLLLGERDRWRLKLVASALMIAGVVLLGRA